MKQIDLHNATNWYTRFNGALVSKYNTMKHTFLAIVIGLSLFACQDPYDGTTYAAYNELPISTYLNSRPNDFSLWVELLNYTNLYNTLNIKTDYTNFAPNNSAMDEYLKSKGVSAVTELNKDEAIYLVRNHILHGKALKKSEFELGAMEWNTANDDKLSVVFGATNGDVLINGYSLLVESDIAVTNGVIHAVNKVLIPITETINNRLSDNRYSIMNQAVQATGYGELLNTISVDGVDINGQPIKKRYYYTLFAVADSTFNANNISSMADLIDTLDVVGNDYTNTSNLLNQYVAYHILSELNSTGTFLESLVSDTSKNINTLAARELINISLNKTKDLRFNFDYALNQGIQLVKADISCKNGVVHEVNNWMPVKTPPLTVVEWDLTDYAELGAVCTSFQSSNPNGGSSTYTKVLVKDEIPTYTWESIPINKSGVVSYVNNRSADGVYYATVNYDHLKLELGAGGWVEMVSPDILKGKYKISISYISYLSTTDVGEMQCYIDGIKVGASFKVSNKSKDTLAGLVLSSSYAFTSTGSHKLRIVGIDGKKLTLDHIKFEPIK